MANLAKSLFQIGYELSPIILTNGIAKGFPGGMMPIILITQAGSFVASLIGGRNPFDTSNYFAHFRPLPGSTLVDNDIGQYPFANQAVAANAIIFRPLRVSMLMLTPVNQPGGYVSKLITFSALKAALDKHNLSGGTYTIATPAYIYTNCIMRSLRDVSLPNIIQPQNAWQFDFEKPLLANADAAQVLNSTMAKISGQLPQDGAPSWSGISSAIGSVKTGLGSLGAGIANLGSLNFGSLNLGSFSVPGLGDISSLSNLSDNLIGTAVSGINSSVGSLSSAISEGAANASSAVFSARPGAV